MTELETMQRAKMYIDKLSQGIDPITDRELPEDTVLNNVRLARCFFYISGILGNVIDKEGRVGKKPGRISTSRSRNIAASGLCRKTPALRS